MEKLLKRKEIPDDIIEYFEEVDPVPIPCIVLDCFLGSGTSAIVAHKHNRKFIGIELNQEYCNMAKKRIENETKQLKLFR